MASTPRALRQVYPEALWQVNTDKKELYLTFDDGPVPGVTNLVLNKLEEYEAKATFFCIGNNVAKNPDLYKRIVKSGHAVGNHTHHHINGKKHGNEIYKHDVELCAQVVHSKLFRPPFGQLKRSQYLALKQDYNIVMWSALSWDFDSTLTATDCANKVLQTVKSGSVIVFHDSKKAAERCLPALDQVLHTLSDKGYSFLPLQQP